VSRHGRGRRRRRGWRRPRRRAGAPADHEGVELTTVVGVILLLNRFANALALPTSSDTDDPLTREGLL